MGLTTDKLPLVKQRLYETMTLEVKGVRVNHTLQQTAMIFHPIQAFYASIDKINYQ